MCGVVRIIVAAVIITGCFCQPPDAMASPAQKGSTRRNTPPATKPDAVGKAISKPGVFIRTYPELSYCDSRKPRLQCAQDCKTLLVCEPDSNYLPLLNVTCPTEMPDCDLVENKCVKRRHKSQCPESPGRGWTCPFSHGYFPDPLDFNLYYFCDDHIAFANYACQRNFVYNTATNACESPKDGQQTFLKCENNVAVHPDDNSLYLFCENDLLIQESYQKCPALTVFNSTTLSCQFKCSKRGNFKDHRSPNKYYSCAFDERSGRWLSNHITCPKKFFYFNEYKGACEDENLIFYKDLDNSTAPLPSELILKHAINSTDEDDDAIVFALLKNKKKLRGSTMCTENKPRLQCAWDCKTMFVCPAISRSAEISETSIGPPLVQIPCPPQRPYCDLSLNECVEELPPNQCAAPSPEEYTCPGPEGYFPDPTDCHKYFYCFRAQPISKYVCPDKYVYDHLQNNCTSNIAKCAALDCKDTYVAKYPGNFSMFGFCNEGKVIRNSFQHCIYPNQEFDKKTLGCEFVCRQEGNMPNPLSNRKYFRCLATGKNGELEISEQKCPKKHKFYPATSRCMR